MPETMPAPLPVVSRLRSLSRAAAVLAILGGLLVLAGRALDVAILTNLFPGFTPMKANPAPLSVLAGASLWLLLANHPQSTARRIARGFAFVIVVVGLLTLCEYVFGWDLGFDQLLFRDPQALPGEPPGRMAPVTTVPFACLGLALLVLHEERPHALWAQSLALMATLLGLVPLVGHVFSAQPLYKIGPYMPIAVLPSFLIVMLGLGTLCAMPDRGLMTPLTSDSAGGILGRRLLLPVASVPLLLGFLVFLGENLGLYDEPVSWAILVVACVVVLTAAVLESAWTLHGVDLRRQRAERERERLLASLQEQARESQVQDEDLQAQQTAMRESEERYRSLFTAMTEGFALHEIIYDDLGEPCDYRFLAINPAFERLTGMKREDVVGKTHNEVLPGNDPYWVNAYGAVVLSGEPAEFENYSPALQKHYRVLAYRPAPRQIAVIVVDITERKQAEAERERLLGEVQRRAVELDVANKEIEAFSYSVSHDLRAPLRGIDGFSQALLEDHADKLDEVGRGYLQLVRSESQRMAQLIDALLALSRITRAGLHWARVDLSALAREVAADLQKAEPERLVEFTITPGLVANGDGRLLQVVLENLIGNAWKFTGKQASARVEFGEVRAQGMPAYFVRDNGAGFDMAYAGKLFGAFQRLHSQSEFAGTGIGLASVQRIIHRHGGRIWAEGQAGMGATFYFTLQMATEVAGGGKAATTKQGIRPFRVGT
ncbi:MAG: ATP-binding protein [Chloroflexi bacterium]|nr:ATP-binding protein [Chloroflexota bacterium]